MIEDKSITEANQDKINNRRVLESLEEKKKKTSSIQHKKGKDGDNPPIASNRQEIASY